MDVVCLVKRYASDEHVSQKPILALPASFMGRLESRTPERDRPMAPLHLERRKMWVDLARLIVETPHVHEKQRAVQYLLKAAEGTSVACCAKSPLPWHMEDHSQGLVRLQDAGPGSSFLTLFPVARFRATLKRR